MATMIGIEAFRTNAKSTLQQLDETRQPITILSRSKPVAVLVHPDEWERLHDLLDDQAGHLAVYRAAGDTIPLDQARSEHGQHA